MALGHTEEQNVTSEVCDDTLSDSPGGVRDPSWRSHMVLPRLRSCRENLCALVVVFVNVL